MKINALIFLAVIAAPAISQAKKQEAYFAAGCFWCVEEIFEVVPGVTEVVSGYSGGPEKNPTYKQVSAGRTGHAEAVKIIYDDAEVSYAKLLEVFWRSHDATDGRGVAPDFGKQYRSALFYQTDEEKLTIMKSKAALEKMLGQKVATQIVPFKKFWPAEDYHQDYVKRNPNDPYVLGVSVPRFKATFAK